MHSTHWILRHIPTLTVGTDYLLKSSALHNSC